MRPYTLARRVRGGERLQNLVASEEWGRSAALARRAIDLGLLKTFRATFAQAAKDAGAPIQAVSRALRHRTTKTTEAFYARIRADDAFREIDRAFERPPVKVGPT